MKKFNFKKFMGEVKFHAGIVLKGFIRTIYGALVAGLLAIAVYGFVSIQGESGYIAVGDFVASSATLMVALWNVYAMGMKKRGGKK